MSSRYDDVYGSWSRDPEGFWARAAEDIHWYRKWDAVLDSSRAPLYSWFAGGIVNTCYNALDRHVEGGRAEQTALVYDSPVTGTVARFTYRELLDRTARFAGALASLGVGKGDRVVIYMPMVPDAVIAMLACARVGAIHSVVFGGFAANELAVRLDDARPKVVLSASCGIEGDRVIPYKPLLDRAIELAAAKPETCVILQRPEHQAPLVDGRDVDWGELTAAAEPADCVPVAATDPLYILYTSGTTGVPKGVVRDNGGHMVALKWSMSNIYGVEPGETYWAASDIGWVVGHSYIVYAPLLHGCTSILYEGKPVGTPDAGAFWRVIAEHGVAALFTAPTAFRAIKREDPEARHLAKYDLARFRTLFLAGERADPDTIQWAERHLGKPVIDHWWQTETAWPIAANCVGLGALPVKYGSPTKAVPGYDIRVLGPGGEALAPGESGAIVLKMPLPPGCLPGLWNNDAGYVESYLSAFPRLLHHRRRRIHRRGRLRLRHGPDRRHHQCRRSPAVHRRARGGTGRASRGRRMCRHRRRPCRQGPGAGGFRGPQGGHRDRPRRDHGRAGGHGPRARRPDRHAQARAGGGAAAQDPIGQDTARHHAQDCRRRGLHGAGGPSTTPRSSRKSPPRSGSPQACPEPRTFSTSWTQ